jgi:hypothetical protein
MSWRDLILLSWCLLASSAAAAETPKAIKPVNLTLNTDADEDEPFLSSSGLTLYYTAAQPGNTKLDILVSQRRALSQSWPRGKVLEGYVQTPADDRGVFVTRDGRYPQYLYYATRKDKEANNFDIYVAVRQDREAVFSSPTPVNQVDTDADEMHPWLSADGRSLYFSRKTSEGWRVFVARRSQATGAGGFGELRAILDLPADYCHATLSPDGKTLYLQGPVDEGRLGLFRSSFTGKSWGKPEPLDLLNSSEGRRGSCSPCLSQDGRMLYFASDRPGGKGGLDLWVVPTAQLGTAKKKEKS